MADETLVRHLTYPHDHREWLGKKVAHLTPIGLVTFDIVAADYDETADMTRLTLQSDLTEVWQL